MKTVKLEAGDRIRYPGAHYYEIVKFGTATFDPTKYESVDSFNEVNETRFGIAAYSANFGRKYCSSCSGDSSCSLCHVKTDIDASLRSEFDALPVLEEGDIVTCKFSGRLYSFGVVLAFSDGFCSCPVFFSVQDYKKLDEIAPDGSEPMANICISSSGLDFEMSAADARYFAMAFRVLSGGGSCRAPAAFCSFCPVKACSYAEAVEFMREYL